MGTKKKKAKGRQIIWKKCQLCRKKLTTAQMMKHEPACRREKLLKVGAKFHVRNGVTVVPVEIVRLPEGDFPMEVRNLETGRLLRLKSFRRLRDWMDKANFRFNRPALKGGEV